MTSKMFHIWVTPAFIQGSPADHTWVTTYDSRTRPIPDIGGVVAAGEDCWYCWGDWHPTGGIPGNPTGFLAAQMGDVALASCLVEPNADSRQEPAARGTVFIYGLDGVCHQLANQVLAATASGAMPPLSVKGARWYGASSFLYRTYGVRTADWAAKFATCSGRDVLEGVGEMPMTGLPDDFSERAKQVLGPEEADTLAKLEALRRRAPADGGPELQGMRDDRTAADLNRENQKRLDEAAALLGPARFEEIFGYPPETRINLVDPAIFEASRGTKDR